MARICNSTIFDILLAPTILSLQQLIPYRTIQHVQFEMRTNKMLFVYDRFEECKSALTFWDLWISGDEI